jgi:hypothetical protein
MEGHVRNTERGLYLWSFASMSALCDNNNLQTSKPWSKPWS